MRERSARPARWAVGAAVLGGALLLAVPLGARSAAIPSGNLVRNPGAEDSPGALTDTVVPIAGWATTGAMTAWTYGALGDRPDKAFATSIGGGMSFFSGGPGGVAGTPTARQSIDVSGAAVEIDAGGVAATLGAHIGGYTVSEDLPQVDAVFYDAGATRLGGIRLGPVNREDRGRLTTLLKRAATASLPRATRRIDVAISVKVDNNGKNQAYVDNVSLTLGRIGASSPSPNARATLLVTCAGRTIVATFVPPRGSAVSAVTFLVNGKPVAIDRKAPFAAHLGTAGLPLQLKIGARARTSSKTLALTRAIRRC